MKNWLARAFRCDLRSLAALRIALGVLVLADLALRLPWLAVYLTDAGAWPRAAAWEDSRLWSLHYAGGSAEFMGGMFALSAAAALALVLGWRTRLATFATWLLLLSLHHRNGLVLNGGDRMLALLLLWGNFLPLGARWSLDARASVPVRANSTTSIATAALLVQVALIYIFNALYKTGEPWQKDASAIADVLHLESYATPLGHYLLGFPGLLHASTRAVWWLELLGPLLPFLPWRHGTARLLAAGLFMGFHAALFCTLRLGLFPLIGVVAWLPFLPGAVWDFLRCREREGGEGKLLTLNSELLTLNAEFAPKQPTSKLRVQSSELRVLPPLAAILLTIVLLWNLTEFYKIKLPPSAKTAVLTLGLEQHWSLFAPAPPRTEGWMVAVLECDDGNEYDALTGAEVDWERPANLGDGLRSASWRLFLRSARDPQRPQRIHWLADWLVREWERRSPEKRVQRIRLHYLWEWLATRQSPPDNWLVYESPPGPLTAELQQRAPAPKPPTEKSDN